ncbi:MAG: hypothetical protein J5I90_16465 [Caldilineales bacterium]|nr:hypothetical protein [Caldilineales bacterium]
MKRTNTALIWGGLLILLGLGLLLQNLGFFDFGDLWGLIFSALFIVGGAAFLMVYVQDQENWWALIPGFILLGIGAGVGLALLPLPFADQLTGPVIVGGISLAFWAVFIVNREQWWAVIPGGILLSVAVMIFLTEFLPDEYAVGVMFLGMALTFVVVALLPNPEGKRMTWAFIPAAVFVVIGFIVNAPAFAEYLPVVGALALIIGGAALLFQAVRKR